MGKGTRVRLVAVLTVVCIIGLMGIGQLFSNVQAGPIHVHIIPHSHCDPGWLETFEGYSPAVRRILSGVTSALASNPSRRFVWAETSFFHAWFKIQNEDTQQKIRQLINSGQFEFVSGGWVQNDEATCTPENIIDQMTQGHKYLFENFGVKPRVAWQIDPFGHSSIIPSLYSEMGFDMLVINRIPISSKEKLRNHQELDFLWVGSAEKNQSTLLTHVLYNHYSAPVGFDFEGMRSGNAKSRASSFVSIMKQQASAFKSNHIAVPWGDDFKFQDTNSQFSNMDTVIEEVNSQYSSEVQVSYSTMTEYMLALFSENIQFPTFTQDFFPYTDNNDDYWTGYYSTRPDLKLLVRKTGAIKRAADIIYAFAHLEAAIHPSMASKWSETFNKLRDATRLLSLVQHHDAITGTSRSKVVSSYFENLRSASSGFAEIAQSLLPILLDDAECGDTEGNMPVFNGPWRMHEAYFDGEEVVFDVTDSTVTTPLVLYNTLAWERLECVSIITKNENILIQDDLGNPILAQIVPLATATANSKVRVYFTAHIPALGCATYFVTTQATLPATTFGSRLSESILKKADTVDLSVENELLKLSLTSTGLIDTITLKSESKQIPMKQSLLEYQNSRGGAYIFSPTGGAADIPITKSLVRVIEGPVVNMVHTFVYEEEEVVFEQQARLFAGLTDLSNALQISQVAHVRKNKEFVTRFSTGLSSQFYTDNGIELRPRNLKSSSAPTNYYPVVYAAALREKSSSRPLQLAFLPSQSVGFGYISEGTIEYVLHRHSYHDDGRGMAEGNSDSTPANVRMLIIPSPIDSMDSPIFHRALQNTNPLFSFTSSTVTEIENYSESYKTTFNPLRDQLPANVHLLSLQPLQEDSLVVALRLQHIGDQSSSKELRSPVDLYMNSLFEDHRVQQVRRTSSTLTRNYTSLLENHLRWMSSKKAISATNNDLASWSHSKYETTPLDTASGLALRLYPLEIHTYITTLDETCEAETTVTIPTTTTNPQPEPDKQPTTTPTPTPAQATTITIVEPATKQTEDREPEQEEPPKQPPLQNNIPQVTPPTQPPPNQQQQQQQQQATTGTGTGTPSRAYTGPGAHGQAQAQQQAPVGRLSPLFMLLPVLAVLCLAMLFVCPVRGRHSPSPLLPTTAASPRSRSPISKRAE